MNYLARFLPLGFASLTLAAGVAGAGCGGTGTAGQPAQPKPTVLTFSVVSGEYSLALDRIVVVSPRAGSPPKPVEIHLLDGHTLDDEVIALGGLSPQQEPTRISVTPDGRHAVVGIQDSTNVMSAGALVYVDLAARRVIATYSMPSSVLDVAANDTAAFAIASGISTSGGAPMPTVYAVDLATGAVSDSGALAASNPTSPDVLFASQDTRVAMNPDGKTLYLDCLLNPYQLKETFLESFTVAADQLKPAATTFGCAGAGLYLSRDGSRVYSAAVYSADLSKMHDALVGVDIADPSDGNPVAAILPSEGYVDVDLLNPLSFEEQSRAPVPNLIFNSNTLYPGEGIGIGAPPRSGTLLFYDAAGTSRFVLMEWAGPDPSHMGGRQAYGIISM